MAEGAWLGLDVGGAHLKTAYLDEGGAVLSARQAPCALWQGLDRLAAALAEAVDTVPPGVAVTMTGELVDLFPDRATGVARLVELLAEAFPSADLLFWRARRGFVRAADAAALPLEVASANWSATAAVAAARLDQGLLVDVGSTTADLVPFADGEVRARGWSDRERLALEELVYTGATRTPLMAVARDAPVLGERVPLMAEHFATTADVWRVLGELPEDADQHPAADAGPKTVEGSMRRLARMVGADLGDAAPEAWAGLAGALAREQEAALLRAAERQLSRGLLSGDAPFVATGSGGFIVRRLAARFGRPSKSFGEIVGATDQVVADRCAPAVAVAVLARERASRTA